MQIEVPQMWTVVRCEPSIIAKVIADGVGKSSLLYGVDGACAKSRLLELEQIDLQYAIPILSSLNVKSTNPRPNFIDTNRELLIFFFVAMGGMEKHGFFTLLSEIMEFSWRRILYLYGVF